MINMAIPRSGSFSKHMQNASENPFVAQIIRYSRYIQRDVMIIVHRQNINMMMKKDNLVLDNNTPLEQVIEILFKIMEKQPSIDQRDKSSTDQLKINVYIYIYIINIEQRMWDITDNKIGKRREGKT